MKSEKHRLEIHAGLAQKDLADNAILMEKATAGVAEVEDLIKEHAEKMQKWAEKIDAGEAEHNKELGIYREAKTKLDACQAQFQNDEDQEVYQWSQPA